MSFLAADEAPLTGLGLRYLGGLDFAVEQPSRWVDPRDGADVPAVQRTDLASVPPFLWGPGPTLRPGSRS